MNPGGMRLLAETQESQKETDVRLRALLERADRERR